MCCIYRAKEVDLVFAFNRKHCACSEAVEEATGFFFLFYGDGWERRKARMRGDLNLSMSAIAIANTLARLLYVCVSVCVGEGVYLLELH